MIVCGDTKGSLWERELLSKAKLRDCIIDRPKGATEINKVAAKSSDQYSPSTTIPPPIK
jgi:hypothetical protein